VRGSGVGWRSGLVGMFLGGRLLLVCAASAVLPRGLRALKFVFFEDLVRGVNAARAPFGVAPKSSLFDAFFVCCDERPVVDACTRLPRIFVAAVTLPSN